MFMASVQVRSCTDPEIYVSWLVNGQQICYAFAAGLSSSVSNRIAGIQTKLSDKVKAGNTLFRFSDEQIKSHTCVVPQKLKMA